MADSRVEVINASGEHLEWVDEFDAHQMIKAGRARCVARAGRIRRVLAVDGGRETWEVRLNGKGSALDGTRYFIDYETETNPPRVYALKYHSPRMRAAFLQVLADCAAVV